MDKIADILKPINGKTIHTKQWIALREKLKLCSDVYCYVTIESGNNISIQKKYGNSGRPVINGIKYKFKHSYIMPKAKIKPKKKTGYRFKEQVAKISNIALIIEKIRKYDTTDISEALWNELLIDMNKTKSFSITKKEDKGICYKVKVRGIKDVFYIGILEEENEEEEYNVTAQFTKCIEARIEKTKNLILVKGKEYIRNNDPFNAFNRASEMNRTTPSKALHGMLSKHLVSIFDMLDDIEKGIPPRIEVVEEKLGDAIVYLHIQEALIKHNLKQF